MADRARDRPPRRWRAGGRAAVTGVVAVVAAGLLAGCGGIPEQGPIMAGRMLTPEPMTGRVAVNPEGPRFGSPPAQIVRDFLLASAGFSANHSIARSFLTPVRQSRWQADTSVVVYPSESQLRTVTERLDGRKVTLPEPTASPTPVASDGTRAPARDGALVRARTATVRIITPVVATVDSRGGYRAAQPGAERELVMGLERVDGEWRIGELQDGILISEDLFTATFKAYPVYFPDRSVTYLVPDLRWFPSTDRTPTSLVEALLGGASRWLSPAVTTGFPEGTRLSVQAVAVEDGIATVDLTEEARRAGPSQRRMLLSQLRETLLQLQMNVRVTVGQADFDTSLAQGVFSPGPSGDRSLALRLRPEVVSTLVMLDRSGRLVELEGSDVRRLDEVDGLRHADVRAPAVSLDGTGFAVLVDDRSRVRFRSLAPMTPSGATTVLKGTRLTAPSIDTRGWVWAASAKNDGVVLAAQPRQSPVRVRAPWLAGFTVRSLRISWDGTRALVAATRGDRAHLYVSGVRRSRSSTPVELAPPVDLVPDLTVARDAVWADEQTVVVLGRRPGSAEQPWRVQVGGRADATVPVEKARTVAARIGVSGDLELHVGTESGRVFRRVGSSWMPVATGRWPTLPG